MTKLNVSIEKNGDTISLDDLTRDSFRQAALEIGLGEKMAMRRFDDMAKRFRSALHESSEQLTRQGYRHAAELEARILQSAGIHSII